MLRFLCIILWTVGLASSSVHIFDFKRVFDAHVTCQNITVCDKGTSELSCLILALTRGDGCYRNSTIVLSFIFGRATNIGYEDASKRMWRMTTNQSENERSVPLINVLATPIKPRGKLAHRSTSTKSKGKRRSNKSRGKTRSPQSKGKKRSLQSKGKKLSPKSRGKKRTPQSRGEKRSPQSRGKKRSPQSRGKKRSPQSRGKERSSKSRGKKQSLQSRGKKRYHQSSKHHSTSGYQSSSGKLYQGSNRVPRSRVVVFVFDISNERAYYFYPPDFGFSYTERPKGKTALSDIEFSANDNELKWITEDYVDSCSFGKRCTRGNRKDSSGHHVVTVKYDPKAKLLFYLTTHKIYQYVWKSKLNGRIITSVSKPIIMELGIKKREVFWTEYHHLTTYVKYVDYHGGEGKIVYRTKIVYGFGVHPEGTHLYICGSRVMTFDLTTRKPQTMEGYPACTDMETDGIGFFVLTRQKTIKVYMRGRFNTLIKVPRLINKGGLRISYSSTEKTVVPSFRNNHRPRKRRT